MLCFFSGSSFAFKECTIFDSSGECTHQFQELYAETEEEAFKICKAMAAERGYVGCGKSSVLSNGYNFVWFINLWEQKSIKKTPFLT